jgi:hypothetical protein
VEEVLEYLPDDCADQQDAGGGDQIRHRMLLLL